MNHSPYNNRATQHDDLTFKEVEPRITAALQIVAINGVTTGIERAWRLVRSYGDERLQRHVWCLLLANGILIGRLKNDTLKIERVPTHKMQRELVAWFVTGNVLNARNEGEQLEVYIHYELDGDGVILVARTVLTQDLVPDCMITGVVPNKFVGPLDGTFVIPDEA